MDIDLSSDDRKFQTTVREFLAANDYVAGSDYNEWRMNWFRLARAQSRYRSSPGSKIGLLSSPLTPDALLLPLHRHPR